MRRGTLVFIVIVTSSVPTTLPGSWYAKNLVLNGEINEWLLSIRSPKGKHSLDS